MISLMVFVRVMVSVRCFFSSIYPYRISAGCRGLQEDAGPSTLTPNDQIVHALVHQAIGGKKSHVLLGGVSLRW